MIYLSLTIDGCGGLELFPHWMDHYRAILEGVPHKLAVRCSFALPKELVYEPLITNFFGVDPVDVRGSGKEAEQVKQQLQSMGMTDRDWYGAIDLDEFWTLPCPLDELVAAAEDNGIHCLSGKFLDRHTKDGTLAAVQQVPSLFEQYPIGDHFTRDALGGGDDKVFLARGALNIGLGHHFVLDYPTFQAPGLLGGDLVCHHFKWKAGVIERIDKALAEPGHNGKWAEEAVRVLFIAAANDGRIPPITHATQEISSK